MQLAHAEEAMRATTPAGIMKRHIQAATGINQLCNVCIASNIAMFTPKILIHSVRNTSGLISTL